MPTPHHKLSFVLAMLAPMAPAAPPSRRAVSLTAPNLKKVPAPHAEVNAKKAKTRYQSPRARSAATAEGPAAPATGHCSTLLGLGVAHMKVVAQRAHKCLGHLALAKQRGRGACTRRAVLVAPARDLPKEGASPVH